MEAQTAEAKGSETYGKAKILFQEGHYEQAVQLLAKSLLEEQSSERWNDWATAKFLAGQAVDAEGGYRRALELAPDNLLALSNLGVLLAGQGRYSEAEPLLEFALERSKGEEDKKMRPILEACKARVNRTVEGGDAANLWKILTRGLSLQAASLDRMELRLIGLEASLRGSASPLAAPRAENSIVQDHSSQQHSAPNRRFAAYLGDHLALTRVLDHFKMYVDTRDISLTPHLLMEGNWEMWITKVFLQLLRPGLTVVDVGANVGYYTMIGAAGVGMKGRVHAVEADPDTFAILEKNIEVNGYGSIVRAHQCAASNSRGELKFYQYRNHHGGNNIFAPQAGRIVGEVKVPGIPLDELIPDAVDVMKIDAEGSEPLIFEGMQKLLERSPRIQILMEFAPQMIERTIAPLDFLKRIRDANLQCKVVTYDSIIATWPDEKLVEPGIHTVLLSRA